MLAFLHRSTSLSQTSIFLTGATGYIGGTILSRLLNHPKAKSFRITALVRSPEKADQLKSKFGVEPIIGSYAELDKLEDASSKADIVFAAVDCDDLLAAKAILSGLKKKYEASGIRPILIHTSGAAVIGDDAYGLRASDKIWDDTAESIASIAPDQIHRPVDLAIEAADTEGYVRTYIVLPPTVYGLASGALVDSGIQHTQSMLIPAMIKTSLDRGRAAIIGKGENIWRHAHIEELGDFYIKLFDAAIADTVGHGHNGYYFPENGEYKMYDVSKEVQTIFGKFGIVKSSGSDSDPTPYTDEEFGKYFGPLGPVYAKVGGSNARGKGVNARSAAIGWNPVKTTEDFIASLTPEVQAILKEVAGSK